MILNYYNFMNILYDYYLILEEEAIHFFLVYEKKRKSNQKYIIWNPFLRLWVTLNSRNKLLRLKSSQIWSGNYKKFLVQTHLKEREREYNNENNNKRVKKLIFK